MYKSQCLTDYYAQEDRGLVPEAGGGARFEKGLRGHLGQAWPPPGHRVSAPRMPWAVQRTHRTTQCIVWPWCNVVERSSGDKWWPLLSINYPAPARGLISLGTFPGPYLHIPPPPPSPASSISISSPTIPPMLNVLCNNHKWHLEVKFSYTWSFNKSIKTAGGEETSSKKT